MITLVEINKVVIYELKYQHYIQSKLTQQRQLAANAWRMLYIGPK